jgi:hypothetical protein
MMGIAHHSHSSASCFRNVGVLRCGAQPSRVLWHCLALAAPFFLEIGNG